MKNFCTLLLMVAMSYPVFSQGDTINITAHNQTHLNWYGTWDEWVTFPDANQEYHKVLMDVTLGCPSGGCSDWDYTIKVELLHPTGQLDSTVTWAPDFTVNHEIVDTFSFNLSPTFTNVFNSQTSSTISVQNDSVWIYRFQNTEHPLMQTDSLKAWPANYYSYNFSDAGDVTDSVWVAADSTWIVAYTGIYDVYPVIRSFELGRLMTPYAGNFNNQWSHTYTFDVTDFLPIMKDSAQIRLFYGGWQDGFNASVKFRYIEGTPPRKPLSIQNIYSSGMGGFLYGNPDTGIETFLTDVKLPNRADAKYTKVRYTASGHSFGGAENCAEFCQKNYYLFVNENPVDTQLIWKTCGDIALYPQAGTWLYDRSGWCPGDITTTYEHDISDFITNDDSILINVDMDAYTYDFNAGFHPNYIVESQLVQYGAMNFTNEAEIAEIVAPNNNPRYSRNNPFGTRPLIKIKNNGAEPLYSLDFYYQINNGELAQYHWEGEINPLNTAIIELPSITYDLCFNNQDELRKFWVEIENPNGVADEWEYNNHATSVFEVPPVYNEFFYLEFITNKHPEENYLEIKDASGQVIFSKDNLAPSTKYRDTLNLAKGFYELTLTDAGGDGLYFWANPDAGIGDLVFYHAQYDIIERLERDFGSVLHHAFFVEPPTQINNTQSIDFEIHPNPANSVFNMLIDNNKKAKMQLVIADVSGKVLIKQNILTNNKMIDVTRLSKGIYFITLWGDGTSTTKKLVIN